MLRDNFLHFPSSVSVDHTSLPYLLVLWVQPTLIPPQATITNSRLRPTVTPIFRIDPTSTVRLLLVSTACRCLPITRSLSRLGLLYTKH